jgi:hypothetical protein
MTAALFHCVLTNVLYNVLISAMSAASPIHLVLLIWLPYQWPRGARCGAVGWGTALQVRRPWVRFPMVSLEFFIGIILSVALWPWGWLNLQQKWAPGIFPGG